MCGRRTDAWARTADLMGQARAALAKLKGRGRALTSCCALYEPFGRDALEGAGYTEPLGGGHWADGEIGTRNGPMGSHLGEKMRVVGRAARTMGRNTHLNG